MKSDGDEVEQSPAPMPPSVKPTTLSNTFLEGKDIGEIDSSDDEILERTLFFVEDDLGETNETPAVVKEESNEKRKIDIEAARKQREEIQKEVIKVGEILREEVLDPILGKRGFERGISKNVLKGAALSSAGAVVLTTQSLTAASLASIGAVYVAITPGLGGDIVRTVGELAWNTTVGAANFYQKSESTKRIGSVTKDLILKAFYNRRQEQLDISTSSIPSDEEVVKICNEAEQAISELEDMLANQNNQIMLDTDILEEEELKEEEVRLTSEAEEKERLERDEEARLIAEAEEKERLEREEEERLIAEAEDKERLKREEEARLIAQEKEREEEERLEREEEERLIAEAEDKERLKREEEARLIAQEKEREEEARLIAEAEEEERLEAALRQAEEEARLAAEEAERLIAEAEEAARLLDEEMNYADDKSEEQDLKSKDTEMGEEELQEIQSDLEQPMQQYKEAEFILEDEWEASIKLGGDAFSEGKTSSPPTEEKDQWESAHEYAKSLSEESLTSNSIEESIDMEELGKAARRAVELFERETNTNVMDDDDDEMNDPLDDISDTNIVNGVDILETKETENYENLTVVKLKEMLRSRGLKVSGRKADLIERLRSS
eukprot:CAMPEP_0184871454 /NCGR_PEP_ID=MMETSP0580-20130426/40728_1 /TAXON_ID=1118495 /ORGANISM="Dactyliosolen fragilissimus" /LENGTH=612 /DNA_ID=CAMNT_0027374115 /DNA_START=483 /DNA_END=2321 /DNA_ORIENTATION=-